MKKLTFTCFALALCLLTSDALMAQQIERCPHTVPRSLIDRSGISYIKGGTTIHKGFFCKYYTNGKLKLEANTKKDTLLLEGISKSYYESGKLKQEASYKNNKMEGQQTGYRENGDLYVTALYKTGSPVSGLCHHTNGTTTPLTNAEVMNWVLGLGPKIECD